MMKRLLPSRGAHVVLHAGALFLLLAALAIPRVANAHANIERAEPAPDSTLATAPGMVRIWFTEPVIAGVSGIQVLDAAGRRVDRGDSRIDLGSAALMTVTLLPLPDGIYTVAWHNTSSVDGHPLRGTYAFSAGASAPGAPQAASGAGAGSGASSLEPAVRWTVLGGLLVALGVEWFALVVLAPVLATREARGTGIEVDRRIVAGAIAVFAIGSLAHLALSLRAESGAASILTGTRWGQMWLLRALLVAAAAAIWSRARDDRRFAFAPVLLLAIAASTLAFASHAAAVRGLEITAVANDLVHTLAAAVWTGGLVALLAVVWRARSLPEAQRRGVLFPVTTRFSPLAMIAAGALLITGLYSTWFQVAAWAAFVTPYGWAVIAKAAVYVALLAVAAVNLLWVTRRLRTSPRAAATLTVTVAAEVALVLAALLAAGFLTSLEPAREAASQSTKRAEVTSGSVRVRVAVTPGSVGANRIEVRVNDRGRAHPEGTGSVTLRLRYAGADLGAREVALQRDTTGAYVVDRVVLSLHGPWQFEASVSSPGAFDTQAAVRLSIDAAGVTGIALPRQATALLAAGWQVVALALLVLAVAEACWRGTRTGQIANWSGTALVVAGIVMVYGVGHLHQGGPAAAGGKANPITSSEQSIALGQRLYGERCIACHGPRGLGDGPSAAGLKPPPASLPLHMPLHDDGAVYAFIEGGFPGSAMPAFRGTLTEEQIWHLVNYLRTLKAGAP